MSNSGKIWDTREAYQKQRANTWETPGNRGMRLGGQTTPGGTNSNTVEFVDMISTGNTADFGDLTQARKKGAGAGGFTRVLCLGGQTPTNVNTIDFVNPVSTGDFSDFGDLLNAGQTTNVSHCNNIKTISADGSGDADGIVITNMASQGNSSFFQNRTNIDTQWAVGTGSNVRFLMAGKYPATNQIDAMEIATTGTKVDFGNLTSSRWGIAAASNSTRSVFMGGNVSPGTTNVIDFVTTASAGNATDFGDLTEANFQDAAGASNSKRAIAFGYQINTINTINIATTGNATDFGDTLTSTFYQIIGADNGGGGLPQEGVFPQRASVNYMPGSGRALLVGGEASSSPYNSTVIEMFMIPTLGNASDFGDVNVSAGYGVNGTSNATRGLTGAGYVHPAASNAIRQVELASQGNTADFGDVTVARYYLGAAASTTRCLWTGGDTGSVSNVIDFKTFASSGNASDFGNLSVARGGCTNTTSSPTRSLMAGGYTPSNQDVIDYVTTASEGDATDFGNLTVARQMMGGSASSTRAVFGGGYTSSVVNVMDYVTIASTGDATDFGDLSVSRNGVSAVSNNTRAVFMAGRDGPAYKDTMDYVTIGSTGNAADFGDLTEAHSTAGNASDNHGGLQSS